LSGFSERKRERRKGSDRGRREVDPKLGGLKGEDELEID